MERAYLFFLLILACLSSALAECPPDSCRCRDSELATCIKTDDANCSVLCLQGNYTAKEPVAVSHDLSLISDGSATVTCNGGGAFLAVSDTDYVELKNVVVKNCFQAVKFENVTRVRITGTTFRNATGSFAVSVADCPDVIIEDSSFFYGGTSDAERAENDIFTTIGQTGGSGLSITLGTQTFVGASVFIRRCNFTGMTNISERIAGRGRGVLISMATGTTNTNLSVEDCRFVSNSAVAYGGGMYITVGDDSSGCNMSLRSNHFEGNWAVGGGGAGILMYSGSRSSPDVNHLVLFNNTFLGNKADFAGGAFVSVAYNGVEGTSILVDQCTFVNNQVFSLAGGALYISSLSAFLVVRSASNGSIGMSIQPVIRDITCEGNTAGSGGTVTLINYPVLFTGRNEFTKNFGPGVRGISTLVSVDGEMYFLDNNMESTGGGALYLSNAQVMVSSGSALIFESNQGSLGASLVSEPVYINPLFTHLPFNPLCFLLYHERRALVRDWEADVVFASNRAQTGSAVYANQLGECAHHSMNSSDLFNSSAMLNSDPPFLYSDNTNSRHMDLENPQWQISTPASSFTLKCEKENGTVDNCNTVVSFPGEQLTLHITPLDDVGDPTYGLVLLVVVEKGGPMEVSYHFTAPYTSSHHEGLRQGSVKLIPSLRTIYPDFPKYNFSYHLHANTLIRTFDVSVRLLSAIASEVEPTQTFTVSIADCPVGNVLMRVENGSVYQTCRCVAGGDSPILQCDLDRDILVLKAGLWGTAEQRDLVTIPCPPGYCSCYYTITTNVTMPDNTTTAVCSSVLQLQYPDAQCACSRQGYLCGACVSGLSVTAVLSTCKSCDNTWIIGIVMLILVDAIVIAAIMLLPMFVPTFHFPTALYSLTFYIQLAPYATANYPASYGSFHQGLRYLGSVLGLYYPFDACLFDGATALDAFSLRYIPFLLAAVISPLTIGIMWCFSKRSTSIRTCRQSIDVKVNYNGVWFVWMLILNDVLATSFAILDRPNNNNQVWYYDGTVSYFTGGHAALALWAIVVMVTLIIAIVYILLVMYFSKQLRFARVLRKIQETVVIGFLEEYPFWFAVDFVKRFVFVAVIIYEKDSEVAAIFVITLYICLYAYLKPYNMLTDNIFELLLLVNFFALMLLRSVVSERDVLSYLVVSPDPTHCSGWTVVSPSYFAIVLGILYYLPVIYAAMPITVAILRCYRNYVKKDRHSLNMQHQRKKSGGGVLATANRSVAILATPTLARRRMEYSALLDESDKKAEHLLLHSLKSDAQFSID